MPQKLCFCREQMPENIFFWYNLFSNLKEKPDGRQILYSWVFDAANLNTFTIMITKLLKVVDLQWLKSSQTVNRKLLISLQSVIPLCYLTTGAEFQHKDISAWRLFIPKIVVCVRAGLSLSLLLSNSCLNRIQPRSQLQAASSQIIQSSGCQREHSPLSPFPGGCDNIT